MLSDTERLATVSEGTNILAGTTTRKIVRGALKKLREPVRPGRSKDWDVKTGERIVAILQNDRRMKRL